MNSKEKHLFELHAEFCQTIANAKRLMIISLLSKGEMSVGELVTIMKTRLSNVSQHLRVLRSRHIVTTRKEGKTVFYRLTDARLHKVGEDIRKLLLDNLQKRGELAKGFRKTHFKG